MKQFKVKPLITVRTSSVDRYLKDINKNEMITPQQEIELANKIKEGDQEAIDKLVTANLRFVVTVAKQYCGNGLELCDLINEGNIGLIKAAKKFDPDKGFKFISYAVWWIRQSILQALANQGRLVRLPLNKIGDISKINQAIEAFIQENQRDPDPEELAEIVGISSDKISEVLVSAPKHVSLNHSINESDDDTLLDITPNEDSPIPDEESNKESLKHDVDVVLQTLTEREQQIIKYIFGLDGDVLTLEEIGEELGLTRERVRQIRDASLEKLRTPEIIKLLKQHLN